MTAISNRNTFFAILLAITIAFAGVVVTGTGASAEERTC